MSKTVKSVILFMVLVLVFLTIPTINDIKKLNKFIKTSGAEDTKNVEIPYVDEEEVNSELDEFIESSGLKKENFYLSTHDYGNFSVCEYDIRVNGSSDNIKKFVTLVSKMEGIKIKLINMDNNSGRVSLNLQAWFFSEGNENE